MTAATKRDGARDVFVDRWIGAHIDIIRLADELNAAGWTRDEVVPVIQEILDALELAAQTALDGRPYDIEDFVLRAEIVIEGARRAIGLGRTATAGGLAS